MAFAYPIASEPTEPFARHLAAFGARLEESRDVLRSLDQRASVQPRGSALASPESEDPRVVLDGWVGQVRAEPGGGQLIVGFILPGEILGSFWRRPEFELYEMRALTRLTTAPAGRLLECGEDGRLLHPMLLQAARRAEDYSRVLLVNQIVRLGGRDAYAGLAHLLVEIHNRLSRVGLAQHGRFRLPIGQRVLARTMGFSVAHTNQTLQRMVADGLLSTQRDVIHLLRPDRLEKLAGAR